jgi:hypothetical protein
MADWRTLPTLQEIRTTVEAALAQIGFKRRGSETFQREITDGLILQLNLGGNEAFQLLHIGVVSKPVNRAALQIWRELERSGVERTTQLYPGVALSQTWVRGGHARDSETETRQRAWHFLQVPYGPPPVSIETFAGDVQTIADQLVRDTPTLEAAVANPRFHPSPIYELDPVMFALRGDRVRFDTSVRSAFAIIDRPPQRMILNGQPGDFEKAMPDLPQAILERHAKNQAEKRKEFQRFSALLQSKYF